MRAHEPKETTSQKHRDAMRRAARRTEHSAISFRSVFGSLKRTKSHTGAGTMAQARQRKMADSAAASPTGTSPGSTAGGTITMTPGMIAGNPGAIAQGTMAQGAASATTNRALLVGATELAALSRIEAGSSIAIAAYERTAEATAQRHESIQQELRLTPTAALAHIADQAGELSHESDLREFRIELEPEHLGPLVVNIRVENGRLKAQLNARDGKAVARLNAEDGALIEQLRSHGFRDVEVSVHQRDSEYFENTRDEAVFER